MTRAGIFKFVAWFVFVSWSSKPCPTGSTPSNAELTTAATLAQPPPPAPHFLEASEICMSAFPLVKDTGDVVLAPEDTPPHVQTYLLHVKYFTCLLQDRCHIICVSLSAFAFYLCSVCEYFPRGFLTLEASRTWQNLRLYITERELNLPAYVTFMNHRGDCSIVGMLHVHLRCMFLMIFLILLPLLLEFSCVFH